MAYEVATSINLFFDTSFSCSALEQIKRTHKAGFTYLDFNFSDWSNSPDSPFAGENWRKWLLEIKSFADQNGIVFIQAHGPLYNIFGEDTPLKRLQDRLSIRTIEAAAILGIPWTVFHAGTYDGMFDAAHIKELKEKNLAWFAPIVKECEKYGVGITLENLPHISGAKHGMKNWYCSVTEDLIDLVDSFDSPHVGICWDTGHAHLEGVDQYANLLRIGSRLKSLHIQDNNGIADQHLPPFYGTIRWTKILEALKDISYEGPFTFEAHNPVRFLPEPCRDSATLLLKQIGDYLVSQL